MKQPNISAIIAGYDDGREVRDVTDLIVTVVLDEHRETATELLTPVIRAAIQRERRKAARRKEDKAFDEPDEEPDDEEPDRRSHRLRHSVLSRPSGLGPERRPRIGFARLVVGGDGRPAPSSCR